MKDIQTQQNLIVVLGMHRSGTSAISRGLQVIGVELGNRLLPPAADNAKGFWEDLDIVAFNDELLKACDCSWHSIDAIQKADVESLCDNGYLIKAIELLRNKLSGHARFGFKDPRTAKLMPFWSKVFENVEYKVCYVLALRNPLSIVKSLASREHFDPEKSYLLWINHMLDSLHYINGQNCIVIDYDELMRNPETELSRLASWIGVALKPSELSLYCEDFLDERLRHSQFTNSDVEFDFHAPALAKEIHNFFCDVLKGGAGICDPSKSGQLTRWIGEFDRLRPINRLIDKQDRLLHDRYHVIANFHRLLAEREVQLSDLTAEVHGLTQKVQGLTEEVHGLTQQNGAILNSTSWRITRPLRV
jgi:hypothetical protein